MNLSNAFETALIKLLFQNIAIALIGDAAGLQPSAVAGSLHISLHTADPGEAGAQNTSEATYTGYARIPVARAAAQWPESGGATENANVITFGLCTAGSETITHIAIGASLSGAGLVIASGALSAPLAVSPGITPSLAVGALDFAAQ